MIFAQPIGRGSFALTCSDQKKHTSGFYGNAISKTFQVIERLWLTTAPFTKVDKDFRVWCVGAASRPSLEEMEPGGAETERSRPGCVPFTQKTYFPAQWNVIE